MATSTPARVFPFPRTCPFDPPGKYERLRDDEPVARVSLWDGRPAWLVTRYEDVRVVLRDPRFSAVATHEGYPHLSPGLAASAADDASFIRMDPPEHDTYRRMLTRDFMIKRVEELRPTIQGIVDDLADRLARSAQPVDLVETFALPIPSQVICHLLGVPYADHDFFQACNRTRLRLTATAEEARAATRHLVAYLDELVTAKERTPGDDLLSRLVVERERSGELTHQEVVAMARLLLSAGFETTRNMISLGVLVLLAHPDQWADLTEDPTLMPQAIEELLRYLTIVQFSARRVALADVELGGQRIRAGDGVIALLASANRDETVFHDAARLDLHRDAHHHLAFGSGVHQCLGQPLARLELDVALRTLTHRFPTLELAVALDQVPFGDTLIAGVHHLPVRWS